MWTKSIDLESVTFPYESPKYQQPVQGPQLSDPKLNNILAEHMQNYYTLTMDKVWTYLDPQEMAMVKKQAAPLKEKVRYGG